MAALPKFKEPTPAEQLRESLAWNLRLALRDGLDEVIRGGCIPDSRDTAANVLYQSSVGYAPEALFEKAVQAAAAGEPSSVIGERFAEFVRAASEHYVETTAEWASDPSTVRWVKFEQREEVAA